MVTGASSGIGLEFARQLARAGWSVTGVARSAARLGEQLADLPGSGHKPLAADLSEAEGLNAVASELESTRYQLFVNNAGLAASGPFEATPIDKLNAVVQVNIEAVYRLAHAYLRVARAGDALINTGSIEGIIPFPGQALYAATKAFIVSLSESLWYEQRARGVYVMALCPGATRTAMLSGDAAFDSVPNLMIGQTDAVVRTALRALARRKRPTVLVGGLNKATVATARLLTRRAAVRMMGSFAPKETLTAAPPPAALGESSQ
jgi:short-subunit dehydrogenase